MTAAALGAAAVYVAARKLRPQPPHETDRGVARNNRPWNPSNGEPSGIWLPFSVLMGPARTSCRALRLQPNGGPGDNVARLHFRSSGMKISLLEVNGSALMGAYSEIDLVRRHRTHVRPGAS